MEVFDRNNARIDEFSREQSIQSMSFGGLNTSASPLNTPYEDSPLLMNCITDISGNVIKRPGTRIIHRDTLGSTGVTLLNFTTGLQYNFLVAKRGKNIHIYEIVDNTVSQIMVKNNVWDDAAKNVRATYVTTSEAEPRIIFATGTNKPVQLRFVEQQTTASVDGSSVTLLNANRFKNSTLSNTIVFNNRQRVTPSSISYSNGSLTINTPVSTGDVIDVILTTWQWYAEALLYTGNQFYGTTTRYNSTPLDQVVKVPESLLTGLAFESLLSLRPNAYSKSSRQSGNLYTYVPSLRPQTSNEYCFSDGSRYDYATNNYANESPFFIVFGALQSSSNPTTVYFNLSRKLYFNNGNGALSANIDVFVDGVKKTQVTTSGSAEDNTKENYWLYSSNGAAILAGNVSTEIARSIDFQVVPLGIRPFAKVEVINKEVKHVGSAAIPSRFDYDDGSYTPAYGLGIYANYESGFYPATVAQYQRRIVFTGATHKPLTILFSNLTNDYEKSWQINSNSTSANDAFDVVIENNTANDRCVTVVEWQSSLFALTRNNTYRITGGNTVLSPQSRLVNYLSSVGCVNPFAWCQTDTGVIYLSDKGVYDLIPQLENGDYQVRELSLKIRSKFGITDDPAYEDLPWMAYDYTQKLVMCGYPAQGEFYTTRYLYVYNTNRTSWTEYDTPSGFNIFSATSYVDRKLGKGFVSANTTARSPQNIPNDFVLLRFNDHRLLDYVQSGTYSESSSFYLPQLPLVKHTVVPNQLNYGVSFQSTQQTNAFTTIPITTINDLKVVAVYPDSRVDNLVFGKDYSKKDGYIYLINYLEPGTLLSIYLSAPGNEDSQVPHINLYVNKKRSTQCSFTGSTLNVTANNGDVIEWGNIYLTYYSTPMFLWNSLPDYKRLKYIYLFFDNRDVRSIYTSGEVQEELIDQYQIYVNANVSIMYNADMDGETRYDLYGFKDIYWDEGVFDFPPTSYQGLLFSIFKEPLQGIGWAYQVAVWNYEDAYFKLCGYQIEAKRKGRRYSGKF